ncbi:MAG: hypothetical protein IJB11_02165, partial [Oscillospiraceae bacterium]|nr:hypothetical protein [Oscillospiraceae bacterium]
MSRFEDFLSRWQETPTENSSKQPTVTVPQENNEAAKEPSSRFEQFLRKNNLIANDPNNIVLDPSTYIRFHTEFAQPVQQLYGTLSEYGKKGAITQAEYDAYRQSYGQLRQLVDGRKNEYLGNTQARNALDVISSDLDKVSSYADMLWSAQNQPTYQMLDTDFYQPIEKLSQTIQAHKDSGGITSEEDLKSYDQQLEQLQRLLDGRRMEYQGNQIAQKYLNQLSENLTQLGAYKNSLRYQGIATQKVKEGKDALQSIKDNPKQEGVDEKWGTFFASLYYRSDFEEKSAYKSTANGKEPQLFTSIIYDNSGKAVGTKSRYTETGFTDPMYDYINGNENAIARVDSNESHDGSLLAGVDSQFLREMSKDEIGIYNYLYATVGKAAADAFIEYIASSLYARQRIKAEADIRKLADEHPIIGSALSVFMSPLKSASYVNQLLDYADDGKIDQNAAYNKYIYSNNAIRDEVSKKVEANWGSFASGAYNTGMGMADFLFTTAITGGSQTFALAIMGTSAAATTTLEAKDRGLSDNQAFMLGTIAGATEVVLEKLPLDELLKGGQSKSWVQQAIRQAVPEMIEEGGSEIINKVADVIISKDKSQWEMAIKQYMEGKKPMTREEAEKKALNDAIFDVLNAAGSGFASGGMLGASSFAIKSAVINSTIDNMTDSDIQALINSGLRNGTEAESYQLAMDLKAKLDKGGLPTGAELKNLMYANNAAYQGRIDAILKDGMDAESINALIESGLESQPHTESYKLAEKLKKQVDKGKTPSKKNLAALYVANDRAISDETMYPYENDTKEPADTDTPDGDISTDTEASGNAATEPVAGETGAVDTDAVADGDSAVTENLVDNEVSDTIKDEPVSLADKIRQEQNDGGITYENNQPQYDAAGTRADIQQVFQRGTDLSDGGPERLAGTGTGEQTGRLGGSPAQSQKRSGVGSYQTPIGRQNRGKHLPQISSNELGLDTGTDTKNLRLMPQELWDDDMIAVADRIYNETGKQVQFVLGKIQVKGASGAITNVRGVFTGDGIIVQADNSRYSISQIADHEAYHVKASPEMAGQGLNQAIRQHIIETFSEEELNRVVNAYLEALDGVYNISDAKSGAEFEEAVWAVEEEVFADAYAGINAFGAHADKFTEAVNEKMDSEYLGKQIAQENGTKETTGPPRERYSVDENSSSIKEQLIANSEKLNSMDPVAKISTPTGFNVLDKAGKQKWVIEKLQPTGYTVDRRGFGIIDFAKKRLKSAFNYFRKGSAEEAVFEALPYVLSDGIDISTHPDHKGRSYGTITIAAPVLVNGKRGNMAAVVKKTTANVYKVHRILTPDGSTFVLSDENEAEPTSGGGVVNKDPLATPISSASNNIVSNDLAGVNRKNVERYSVDDSDYTPRSDAKIQAELDAEKKRWEDAWLRDRLGDVEADAYLQRQKDAAKAADEQKRAEERQKTEHRKAEAKKKAEEKAARNKQAREERHQKWEEDRAKRTAKEEAESRPTIAKKELRRTLLDLFSIPVGSRGEIATVIDQFADRLIREGNVTEESRKALFDRLYQSGVMTIPAEEVYQLGRGHVTSGHIYVNDSVRAEFGDDWNTIRKRAFAAGVYLTNDPSHSGIDSWNSELAELLPGLFDSEETDLRMALERIVQVAEDGKDEKVSLPEYTARLAGIEHVSEDAFLDHMERKVDEALRTFAKSAELEIHLKKKAIKDRADLSRSSFLARQKLAQERDQRKEMSRQQQEQKELRELQQRTLKNLQWLSKNRNRMPEELKPVADELLGDLDILAVGAANEMRWSDRYNATWRDAVDMYKHAKENDPNFMPSEDLERMMMRLDGDKIADLDVGALQTLYKAVVGLRTEYHNRNNVINDEMNRLFAEVYTDSKHEIETAPGGYTGGKVDKFFNNDQLTPMNVLHRMGGWNPNGTFYSMAKQLEKGERDVRAYTVKATRMLENFLTEHQDFVKKSDGQGKDAIWYELEVPELVQLGMGDKPIFGDTIKVYMTPAQKVHLYLESKNMDNLRHMLGGRTFVNKELYSKGKRQEALAQGTTVRLAPETVKKIVSDLTAEEMELAQVLETYYNTFATTEINRVSNVLYGYDKAMGKNYAPIYTNQNYTKSEFGVFDATAEGVGNLKERHVSKNPSYNISCFDAFERHVDQTARFVGMAIPARNWTTLMNWREKNNSTADVITHKWGDEGKKYITDLLTTLQGGKDFSNDTISGFAGKLMSNYISAVFGANPSIVLKQLGSIPMASAYLGISNAPSISQVMSIDKDLISKYSQDLAWRTMGYTTPETKQLKENPNWTQTNKFFKFTFGGGAITAMDGWAASTLWPWAENKVRKEFPDLEVGTQEQIDAGLSPFYKKVAEEFEAAMSRSQSVSDEMHQGQLRKSKNPITKAFTMFRSDSAQTYNTLRQKFGEAMYYARNGESKQVVKAAKKAVGAAVLATMTNAIWAEAVSFLTALWKNKGKKYRDEEEELTAESVLGEMVSNMLYSMAGTSTGGEELAQVIGNLLTGEKIYDIEVPGMEQVNDLVDVITKSGKTLREVMSGAVDVAKNDGDLGAYFSNHVTEILGGIKELAEAGAMYFGGLSVSNLEGYLLGAIKWASPELGVAYDDMFSQPNKNDLSGLTGDALEVRLENIFNQKNIDVSDD